MSIAPGLHTGFLYYWPKSTLLLEAELYQFLFDQTQRSKITFQQSLQLSKNDSLRLSADFHHIGSNMHENKNLVLPMITGKKSEKDVSKSDAIPHSKLVLAAIIAICCISFVYWLVIVNAPVLEEFYY